LSQQQQLQQHYDDNYEDNYSHFPSQSSDHKQQPLTSSVMTDSDRKSKFDCLALGCISFLENSDQCRAVIFHAPDIASDFEINNWDKRHHPCTLPEDMKRFYALYNGFTLTWSVNIADKVIAIGDMRLNKLDCVVPKPNLDFNVNPQELPSDVRIPDFAKCVIFSLDSFTELGEIVLLYRPMSSSSSSSSAAAANASPRSILTTPEVWLLDLSGGFHFICHSFTQYLRLMVSHLGIYGWQMAFTSEGLSETTQQWMSLFCKERLIVDRHYKLCQ
jgi:hypothetical protein